MNIGTLVQYKDWQEQTQFGVVFGVRSINGITHVRINLTNGIRTRWTQRFNVVEVNK